MKSLTRDDFVHKMIEKVRSMNRETDMIYTAEDLADEEAGLASLRHVLKGMPEDAMFLLLHALTTGYTIECNCGRIWEVDSETGEIWSREHAGAPKEQ